MFLLGLLSLVALKNHICGISEDHPIDSNPALRCNLRTRRPISPSDPGLYFPLLPKVLPGRGDGYDWIHRIGKEMSSCYGSLHVHMQVCTVVPLVWREGPRDTRCVSEEAEVAQNIEREF